MPPGSHLVLFSRAGQKLLKRELREFAETLQSEVTDGRAFTVLITDDRELTRLNHQFRGKNYPADVLSFPADNALEGAAHLGEVAISSNRAEEQASEHGHTHTDEVKILMLHGVLHLLGMDHESDRGQMARAEKRWRKTLGLETAGLIERARS